MQRIGNNVKNLSMEVHGHKKTDHCKMIRFQSVTSAFLKNAIFGKAVVIAIGYNNQMVEQLDVQ